MGDEARFENYPAKASEADRRVPEGPPGTVVPTKSAGLLSRRNVVVTLGGVVLAGIAFAAGRGGPEPSPVTNGSLEDDGSASFDSLEIEGDLVRIRGDRSISTRGWVATQTSSTAVRLDHGDNRFSLWLVDLLPNKSTREDFPRIVKKLGAFPSGVALTWIGRPEAEGVSDEATAAGGSGRWHGKPVQVLAELWPGVTQPRGPHGKALLASLWLTDGLGSRAFQDGHAMLKQAFS